LGPPVAPWVIVLLFAVSAALIVLIPWLLVRERAWFDRWILSRRDFVRILALWVGFRAVEVARIARHPREELVSIAGFAIPMPVRAWLLVRMTVAVVLVRARAGGSRDR